jgi:hypothetical protein
VILKITHFETFYVFLFQFTKEKVSKAGSASAIRDMLDPLHDYHSASKSCQADGGNSNACTRQESGSNLDWGTSCPSCLRFHAVSLSYQVNYALVPQYGEDRFFPNPSQFIIHQSSYHMTLASDDDSAVKQHNITVNPR